MHTAMKADWEMITSVVITGASVHDGKQFSTLVEKDRALPIETHPTDCAYNDSEHHDLLEKREMHSANSDVVGMWGD